MNEEELRRWSVQMAVSAGATGHDAIIAVARDFRDFVRGEEPVLGETTAPPMKAQKRLSCTCCGREY